MKKTIFYCSQWYLLEILVTILFHAPSIFAQSPDCCPSWTQVSDIGGTNRYQGVGFSVQGKGYVGLGTRSFRSDLGDFWEYDPLLKTWTQVADFGGGPRDESAAFTVNDRAYILAGIFATGTFIQKQDLWEYNPQENRWIRRADIPGGTRFSPFAFSIGDKAYAGGGAFGNGTVFREDFYEYDPNADTWTRKADHPYEQPGEFSTFSLGAMGYVSGFDASFSFSEFWAYDPAQDRWIQKEDLPIGPLTSSVGFALNGEGYVGTGRDINGNFTNAFWSYNPDQDQWTRRDDLCAPVPRREAQAFVINSEAYVVAGLNPDESTGRKDAWRLNSANRQNLNSQWIAKSDFPGASRSQGVGFSIDGMGYIGTGNATGGSSFKDFWKYDPQSDTWTQVADLGGSARNEAVGFALLGKGYVATGVTSNNQFLNDLWAYDPNSNSWEVKASLPASRRLGAFAFVIGDKAYLGTGQSGNGFSLLSNLSDFWEYDPSQDRWTRKADFAGPARREISTFSIQGKGYAGLGGLLTPSGELLNFPDFWEYDPTDDKWTKKSKYPGTPVSSASGFALGGFGYFGLGITKQLTIRDEFWRYDALNDSWDQVSDFCGGLSREASSFVIEDRAYIATGLRPDGSSRRDVYEFIPPSLGITSIALIDASQDQRLLTLSDGMIINLDDLNSNEFSLQAFPNFQTVGSVSLELQGPKQQSTLENFFPYTLFGDQDGKDIQGVDLLPGNYTITATPYSQINGQGEASNSLSISFTVIGTPQPKVQGFLLINADTDEVIQEIKADDVISVDALGIDHFSIQALTSPREVGSVKMLLTGPNRAFGPIQDERLENQPPYTLYGDDNGKDIQGRDFFVGERAYTIRASAFTGGNATGDQGPERTVSFRIVSNLSIGALTLVNADTDQDIVTLSEGRVFNSSEVVQNLSIRSDVLGAGSVRLILRDAQGQVLENRIENVKPYSLFGENDPGDFIGNAFASGQYQIEVQSYARSRGLGSPGANKIIHFEVINSPASAFGIWDQADEVETDVIQIVAYPNPTQQRVELDIPEGLSDEIVVEVFNKNGQSVLRKTSSNQQGIMELDLSQQAEGMYFIVLKDASGRTMQKRVLKK